jgi:hypothetical protein
MGACVKMDGNIRFCELYFIIEEIIALIDVARSNLEHLVRLEFSLTVNILRWVTHPRVSKYTLEGSVKIKVK